MLTIKKIIDKFVIYTSKTKLHVLKTIYINFKMLPFRDAMRLPVYIYGKCQIICANGTIILPPPHQLREVGLKLVKTPIILWQTRLRCFVYLRDLK